MALGEDRALSAALRRVDARIRHAPEVWVTVSGRLIGQAAGGMFDTIRCPITRPDSVLDDAREPAAVWTRQCNARAMLRRAHANGDRTSLRRRMAGLGCAPGSADGLLGRLFGALWEAVEPSGSGLARQPVPVTSRPIEMASALMVRAALMRLPVDTGRAYA